MRGGGGWRLGYSWEFLVWVGVCCQVLQILTLFKTKKRSFSTPVFRPVISAEKLLTARPLPNILGDPGASQSGRVKRRDESFQAWAEEPLGTDSRRTISKRSSQCLLLIGHIKCFVLLCSIGEQHLLSSFREFVHDGF